MRFYEESTYWNPLWALTRGAVQTPTIGDFATSIVVVGEGTLLSGVSACWPERMLSIAVTNTYGDAAFDETGRYDNARVPLFKAIANYGCLWLSWSLKE